jgi:hypothetical protein
MISHRLDGIRSEILMGNYFPRVAKFTDIRSFIPEVRG